ncbi:MAG: hypothetical protein PQJ46_05780 [Spirochaetales bacterium]|nr:hypothetical protein [Spirochaetales bacterium]
MKNIIIAGERTGIALIQHQLGRKVKKAYIFWDNILPAIHPVIIIIER